MTLHLVTFLNIKWHKPSLVCDRYIPSPENAKEVGSVAYDNRNEWKRGEQFIYFDEKEKREKHIESRSLTLRSEIDFCLHFVMVVSNHNECLSF